MRKYLSILVVFVCLTISAPIFALNPSAVDDGVATFEDQAVFASVLDNDSDPEGGALTIVMIEGQIVTDGGVPVVVPNGIAALSRGRIVFIPASNFFGTSTFGYTVEDPEALQATAMLSVDVNSVEDRPILDLNGGVSPGLDTPSFAALEFQIPIISNVGQTEESDGVGNGEKLLYSNAGILSGVPVDVIGTVVRNTTGTDVTFYGTNGQLGVRLVANGEVLIHYAIFESGTQIRVSGDIRLWVDDLDGARIKDGIRVFASELTSYVLDGASEITVSDDGTEFVGGSQGPSFRPETALELEFIGVDQFSLGYLHIPNPKVAGGRGITLDGAFDSILTNSVRTILDVDYQTIFTEGDAPVSLSSPIAGVVDVEDNIDRLTINASGTNLDSGFEHYIIHNENFELGTPKLITSVINNTNIKFDFDGTNWVITEDGGGAIPVDVVRTLIRGMTYENKSFDPTETDRTISFVMESAGAVSNSAQTKIEVTAVDDFCGDSRINLVDVCDEGNANAVYPADCSLLCKLNTGHQMGMCVSDDSCEDVNATCLNSLCRFSLQQGPCVDKTQCHDSAAVCDSVSSTCLLPNGSGICMTGTDCQSGRCNDDSVCVQCLENSDCGNGDVCISLVCQPPSSLGGKCDPNDDEDCQSTIQCNDNGVCGGDGAACSTNRNDDCVNTCISDVCKPKSNDGDACDNGDGAQDCVETERSCRENSCVVPEEICSDTIDNDGDGNTDCDDSDCVDDDSCTAPKCEAVSECEDPRCADADICVENPTVDILIQGGCSSTDPSPNRNSLFLLFICVLISVRSPRKSRR